MTEADLEKEVQEVLGFPAKIAIVHENLDPVEFFPEEKEVCSSFKGKRLESWLKGRRALKQLLKKMDESSGTAFLTFPNPRFSLTHTGDTAAAAGLPPQFDRSSLKENSGQISGIGIDLELHRAISLAATRFFLNQTEKKWILRFDFEVRELELLRLWTIKEALYKANPENKGTFLFQYALKDPELSVGEAVISTFPDLQFMYASFRLQEGFFSFAVSKKLRTVSSP